MLFGLEGCAGDLLDTSPSLISLSPLPSAHPEAFQRLLVRSSSWCYPAFNLAKGRSLGFASATADYTPCSDSLSLRIRVSSHLTLPAKATRRFIMQKARRHSLTSSDRLQAHGFRNYFTLLFEVLFTFPSRYWFAIGLSGVFSLTGWSRQIHAEFLVLRATQDTTMLRQHSNTQLSCSMVFLSRKFFSDVFMQRRSPTTPPMP